MRVLITGATGMVGAAVTSHCVSAGDDVVTYSHQQLDIRNTSEVMRQVAMDQPEAIINCAAWTDVDGCESDSQQAIASNAGGPANLAKAAREVGAVLVTISTDYVFDGEKNGFYTQRDNPNPTSVYAKSKLEGEYWAQNASARTIIVRSGFIFGPGGRNFLSLVGKRITSGETILAISDTWGTPTYCKHLAQRLRELAVLDLPGIYHVVNAGIGVSYEEFAVAVKNELGLSRAIVCPVPSESLNRPARRPKNSRLRCLMSPALGLAPLPDWRAGLREFIGLS